MGYSAWSDIGYKSRSVMYSHKSTDELFENTRKRIVSDKMQPMHLGIREARDSEQHPNSLAVMVGLDLTGSMGHIPDDMVRQYLGQLMNTIITSGIPDVQIMMLGVGDHECDRAPLQVGQFESGEELDNWLLQMFLEKGGGGNFGESYLLAWLVAAKHTAIDCHEKRGQKGFLFTIGDEPCLHTLPAEFLKGKMGYEQASDLTREQLLEEAQKRYHVFHIHCAKGSNGSSSTTVQDWKKLLGQNLIILDNTNEICEVIAKQVASVYKEESKTGADIVEESTPISTDETPLDEGLFK